MASTLLGAELVTANPSSLYNPASNPLILDTLSKINNPTNSAHSAPS